MQRSKRKKSKNNREQDGIRNRETNLVSLTERLFEDSSAFCFSSEEMKVDKPLPGVAGRSMKRKHKRGRTAYSFLQFFLL